MLRSCEGVAQRASRSSSGRRLPARASSGRRPRRRAGSTSPTSLPSSVRLTPTSITVAPGFTMSGVTSPGRPTAATRMSARRVWRGEVVRARVADRHRRVLGKEEHRHRLADDLAPPDHDRLVALQLDPVLLEHHHHARGRRRHEERLAEVETARVEDVEAVDVLGRVDRAQHRRLVHVRGERKLDEDPVDTVVRVELVDEIEDRLTRRVSDGKRWSRDSIPASCDALCFEPTYVCDAGSSPTRMVARQTGSPNARTSSATCARTFSRERLTVDPHRRHRLRSLVTEPMRACRYRASALRRSLMPLTFATCTFETCTLLCGRTCCVAASARPARLDSRASPAASTAPSPAARRPAPPAREALRSSRRSRSHRASRAPRRRRRRRGLDVLAVERQRDVVLAREPQDLLEIRSIERSTDET